VNKENKNQSAIVKSTLPKTTAALIGWRSTDPKYKLDKYGSYTKGRQTITKSLNWPDEAI